MSRRGKELDRFEKYSCSEENPNRGDHFRDIPTKFETRFLSFNFTDLFARTRMQNALPVRLTRTTSARFSFSRSIKSFQGTSVKWTLHLHASIPAVYLNRIRDVDVERDHWQLDTLDDWLITSFERNARDELIRRCPLWFSRRKIVEWEQKKKKNFVITSIVNLDLVWIDC